MKIKQGTKILLWNKHCEEMVFCYKNCSGDREKLSKFKAEGREVSNFLRSLTSDSKRLWQPQ